MPIGDSLASASRTRCGAALVRMLGTLDLHSHTRLRPLCRFLRGHLSSCTDPVRVVEVGCGVGINAFELAKAGRHANKEIEYVGVDLSADNIKAARSVCVSMGLSNVRFYVADAIDFLKTKLKTLPGFDRGADAVFLMDVVEHIHEPQVLLQHAHAALKSGGVYVVSVPTPLYPRVFGRYMHQRVGHVVDGYDRGTLDTFFAQGLGCERLQLRYNTGFPCNLGCCTYYRLHPKNRYLNVVKCLALYPFRYADWLNGKRVSCSLFTVYRKP